eukprot:2593522-Pleurochrysis_carterae.AAC.5
MERTFSREAAALARSGWAGPAASPKCSDAERHQMYVSATAWLRSSQRAEKRRKRRVASVGTVLGARGYVRGPLRQVGRAPANAFSNVASSYRRTHACVWAR